MIYVLLNIHKVAFTGCAHMNTGSGRGYGDVIQGHQGVMMEREENWEPSFHQGAMEFVQIKNECKFRK